jgi:hypothetical protein
MIQDLALLHYQTRGLQWKGRSFRFIFLERKLPKGIEKGIFI